MSLLPEELLSSMTPEEWIGVITGAEGGPWPPCCANVSAVRDLLCDLLVCGGTAEMVAAAQALERERDDHLSDMAFDDPVPRLHAKLVAHLDGLEPSWRDQDLGRRNAELDEFALRVELTGTSTAPRAGPAGPDRFTGQLAAAAAHVCAPDLPVSDSGRVEWWGTARALLDELRVAGAPVEVVAGFLQHARTRLVSR